MQLMVVELYTRVLYMLKKKTDYVTSFFFFTQSTFAFFTRVLNFTPTRFLHERFPNYLKICFLKKKVI